MLALALATATVALARPGTRSPAAAQGSIFRDLYLPLVQNRFDEPYPTPAVATHPPAAATEPGATAPPTATRPPASATAPPTGTRVPATATHTPTIGPTPTPTLKGGVVPHPTDADTIILQIGFQETVDISQVWEEMNGTPWFTVYGDGRVIAGRKLDGRLQPDNRQELLEGQASEDDIQRWLRALTYDAQFFTLQGPYQHPANPKPWIHTYANVSGGDRRVSLYGFRNWVRAEVDPDLMPPEQRPDLPKVKELVKVVLDINTFVDRLSTPYVPECFTVIIQEQAQDLLEDPPTWSHSINARAIATAAPTAASNYVNKLPGHKFVNRETGLEVREIIVPLAEEWFPGEKLAMEFKSGREHYGIGARQEVPGGSPFMPENYHRIFYRRDPPSGSCSSLPRPDFYAELARLVGRRSPAPPEAGAWPDAIGQRLTGRLRVLWTDRGPPAAALPPPRMRL